MNGVFHIGATGLRAQERALGVTANNIANMNTPGFKRSRANFGEIVATAAVRDDPVRLASPAPGGVSMLGARTVFERGDMRVTGSSLDIALDGDGFIEVLGAQGQSLLWRGGTLSVGSDGLLSTVDGLPLRGLIQAPADATDLRVTSDGAVWAVFTDGREEELGRIDLVMTRDMERLEPLGGGYYRAADALSLTSVAPGEEGAGLIRQGMVEASNVALADEMVTLMLLQRAYAASAQALQAGDQLMAIANGLRR